MRFSREKKDQSSWLRDIIVDIVLGLVLIALIILIIIFGRSLWGQAKQHDFWFFGDNGSQEESIGICLENEVMPSPLVLLNDFQEGDILKAGKTYTFDAIGFEPCGYAWPQIHRGDVIQITGKAQLSERSWRWPIKVLQGGVYAEGVAGLLRDEERIYLYPTSLGERPVPDFAVGEIAKVSYNFILRDLPNGNALIGEKGLPLLVYGGQTATIIQGPTLAEDRYWCKVKLDYSGLIGWISCEFKKVAQ